MAALTVSISNVRWCSVSTSSPDDGRDHGDDIDSLNPDSKQRLTDTFGIDPQIAPARCTSTGPGSPSTGAMAFALVTTSPTAGGASSRRSFGLAPIRVHSPGRCGSGTRRPRRPGSTSGCSTTTCMDRGARPSPTFRLGRLRRRRARRGVHSSPRRTHRLPASIFGTVWNMNSARSSIRIPPTSRSPSMCTPTAPTATTAPARSCSPSTENGRGNSVLVDGFAAAQDFQAQNPEAADLLTRYAVTAHYVEPGVHLVAERPPLRVDEHGTLVQVCSTTTTARRCSLTRASSTTGSTPTTAFGRCSTIVTALVHPWQPGRVRVRQLAVFPRPNLLG